MIRFLKRHWLSLLVIILSLFLFDLDRFLDPFLYAVDRFLAGQWFERYSSNNPEVFEQFMSRISTMYQDARDWIVLFLTNSLEQQSFMVFMINVLNNLLLFLKNVTNYGLNSVLIIYFMFYMFVDKEVDEVKTTRSARAFMDLLKFISFIFSEIHRLIRWIWHQRRMIFKAFLIYLFFNGFLMRFIFESLTFAFYYFASPLRLETLDLFFSIFKSAVILIILYVPVWLQILSLVWLFWTFSKNRAIGRLEANFDGLKTFIKYDLSTFTILTGIPGIGKTRSMTNLGLAAEEVFIEEIEDSMTAYELDHPEVNWGEFDMTRLFSDPQHGNSKIDYLRLQKEHPYYLNMGISLYKRGTFLATVPYVVNDPYAEEKSVILDWDWLRPRTAKDNSPIQPYLILLISELDKEANSHYNVQQIGEDGLHIAFGTISHQASRRIYVIADYQDLEQVPKNLRSVAEWFIKLTDSKVRYPFFLGLWRKPFSWSLQIVTSILKKYQFRKLKLRKDTRRTERAFRKRFDYTLVYAMLRFLYVVLARIDAWFYKFTFTVYRGKRTNMSSVVMGKVKYAINIQDEYWRDRPLYDSVFLKGAFTGKSSSELADKPIWARQRRYSDMAPSMEDLIATHSHFIEEAFASPGTSSSKEEEYPFESF